MRWAFVAVAILAAPAWQQRTSLSVRYVANAGVLLTLDGTDVLIDAPIRDGIPPYATSDPSEREKLEGARAPYDRVSAILVTHWHEDHFSPEAIAAHLASNARAVLVSSPEVVDRVRAVAPALAAARVRPVLPEPGQSALVQIGSLPVRVLRIRHNRARRFPEQHVGFLVGEAAAVLHTGDADPTAENFEVLRGLPRVDLALLPNWFLLTDRNREFVRTSIAPARIAAMHIPPGEADQVRRTYDEARVRAALLVTPATTVVLP
jgi:L-ascorbate metabolism protein UlaG (beta-lactamase superfamily)